MELVGRDVELGVLRDALAEARRGRGQLVLVAGAAGMGKTGLVTAFADEAAGRGATVLEGAGWEAGGAPAYWPWTQVLRGLVRVRGADTVRSLAGADLPWLAHLLPELGPPGPIPPGASEGSRFAFVDAVSGVLLRAAADTPPLVVLLDDLHVAGGPAGRLLLFLARQIRSAPMLLVGTYRPVEAGWDPEVGEVVAGLEAAGTGVRLAPLDPAAVAALIARTLGRAPGGHLAATIVERTGGNPLFVTQVGRLLASGAGAAPEDWPVPPGIRQAIRARVARLSGMAGPLGAAAVLGREFDFSALETLTATPAADLLEPLAAATEAELVEPLPGGRYRFAHDLVRETVYGDLSPQARTWLHAAVAALLAARPGDDPEHLALLAHHALAAVPFLDPTVAADHADPPRGRPREWPRTSGLRSCTPVPSPRWSYRSPPTYLDAAGSRSRWATRSSGGGRPTTRPRRLGPGCSPRPQARRPRPACPGRARAHRAPGLQRHRRRRARAAR